LPLAIFPRSVDDGVMGRTSKLILVLLTLMFNSANAADVLMNVDPMKCLMDHPLIAGASVSAGLDGVSFGDQLATRYKTEKKIIHEAYANVSGATVFNYQSFPNHVKEASVVVALDFFYWDQTTCDLESINKTIDGLFQKTVKSGIPLVIGNLNPGHDYFKRLKYETECATKINQKLKSLCDQDPKKCLLINTAEMETFITGYFVSAIASVKAPNPDSLGREQEKYINVHITRDGVHPRTDAYTAIANYLEQTIQHSQIECRKVSEHL